jgi:tetratricopeptide (TPR) repeat protein
VNTSALLRQAVQLARDGKRVEARDIFLRIVEEDPRNELAWMWLAGLVDSLEDKIIACENVLTINPSNEKAIAYLEKLKRRKESERPGAKTEKTPTAPKNPLDEARYLEQEGKFEEALLVYKVEAAKANDTHTFNEIYKKIVHIEQLQFDRIRFVTPRAAIVRLTLPWSLLYLSLAFVQVGLNPLRHPTSYLWFAFPWVVLGSYLIAVSEVRSRHPIWKRLFSQNGDGSFAARLAVGALGWLMVLIPMILIVIDSLNRLSEFQIPPRLF